MPINEYKCEACGHEFEEIQKFSDKPLVKCPACKKSKLKKMISLGSFHLKGRGWHKRSNTIGIKKEAVPED